MVKYSFNAYGVKYIEEAKIWINRGLEISGSFYRKRKSKCYYRRNLYRVFTVT